MYPLFFPNMYTMDVLYSFEKYTLNEPIYRCTLQHARAVCLKDDIEEGRFYFIYVGIEQKDVGCYEKCTMTVYYFWKGF